MPYKTGKMKGELTTPEIRKLIKAHNVLVSIKIPKGAKREDIIALVKKNGYEVNHEKKALVPKVEMQRKKTIGLKKAQEITKPKPKTALEKQKIAEAKAEKEEKKKKEERVIRKKAVEEEKKRAKPKPKTATISTQTEEPKKPLPKKVKKKVEKKKKEGKFSKDKIDTVFKDIMTVYKEIVDEGILPEPQDKDDREQNKNNRKKIRAAENIKKKYEEGKMTFTSNEKKTIASAIFAYLDMDGIKDDPDLADQFEIAKMFNKKYEKFYDASF